MLLNLVPYSCYINVNVIVLGSLLACNIHAVSSEVFPQSFMGPLDLRRTEENYISVGCLGKCNWESKKEEFYYQVLELSFVKDIIESHNLQPFYTFPVMG